MNLHFGISQLILNTDLPYHFNPFGGIHEEEIEDIFVPRSFSQKLIRAIQGEQPGIIELVGSKGRGKTTHLRYLHTQFPQYPLFLPKSARDYEEIYAHPAEILFLDSVHKLTVFQRIQLYRKKRLIILTTHWKRNGEYILARRPFTSYSFRGIDEALLTQVLKHRISLATGREIQNIHLKPGYIRALISQHGDNLRSILNQLYDVFNRHDQL